MSRQWKEQLRVQTLIVKMVYCQLMQNGYKMKRSKETLDDLGSEFDVDSDAERLKIKRLDLAVKEPLAPSAKTEKDFFHREKSSEERKRQRILLSLDAYSRHKKLINDYILYYPGATGSLKRDTSADRTDIDVIRQNHKFVWEVDDEADSWEKRLAKKYYDKLFKEYCITDLTRYKENKVALRWRTEREVIDGKGQFVCGNKKCSKAKSLTSWEVNFAYIEEGKKKNCLVKLRLCPDCSYQLNYKQKRRKVEKRKKRLSDVAEPSSSSKTSSVPVAVALNSDKAKAAATEESCAADTAAADVKSEEKAKELWRQPAKNEDEKSREDEFEEFLDDMLL